MVSDAAGAVASKAESERTSEPAPETTTSGRAPDNSASAAAIIGSIGADTTTARARLSAIMKANSPAVSWVLTATGTTPALIAPRKAVGKSIVSCRQRRMRCSG